MKKFILACLTVVSLALVAAGPTTPRKSTAPKRAKADSSITQIIESFTARFAPDKRTAIFQIDAFKQNNQMILTGRTNLIGAKSTKYQSLMKLKPYPNPNWRIKCMV